MKSVIIGAGTYGEVYLAYLQEAGIEIVGFLDDNPRYINQKAVSYTHLTLPTN